MQCTMHLDHWFKESWTNSYWSGITTIHHSNIPHGVPDVLYNFLCISVSYNIHYNISGVTDFKHPVSDDLLCEVEEISKKSSDGLPSISNTSWHHSCILQHQFPKKFLWWLALEIYFLLVQILRITPLLWKRQLCTNREPYKSQISSVLQNWEAHWKGGMHTQWTLKRFPSRIITAFWDDCIHGCSTSSPLVAMTTFTRAYRL